MTSTASASSGRPRKRIGRYLLTGRIGKGGMGRVYRGYDEALEREVAVKTLSFEGSLDEEHRKRFSIEAKAAARLQHPNIVTVFELGEDRGVPFIAMELLPGADLEGLLRSGEPLLLQEKLDIAVQVCRGLHFAHERGIVHRDIKPSNIRVLDDGSVKIMDFGIAKLGASGITKSGMMVGTIHYMSPEQIRGQALDGRSDVFSVGVILYELLAERRPFLGETATEILYKIVHEEPPPLAAEPLGPAGPALQDLVARALAKEPAQRFASAAALADQLSRVLAEHLREIRPAAAPELVEEVKLGQRLLAEQKDEEGLTRLRQLTEQHPHAVEARRALRWATREAQRRQAPSPAGDDFPELEATMRPAETANAGTALMEGRTDLQSTRQPALPPTVLEGRRPSRGLTALTRVLPLPEAVAGRPLLAVGAVAVALAGVLGGWLLLGTGKAPAPEVVDAPPPRATSPPPVVPALVPVTILSQPEGAKVSVDGKPVEGLTPLKLTLDGSVAHRLKVTLAGHAPREVQVAAGAVPAEVRVVLEPSGPLGKVAVISPYAVDVLWKGRLLAKGESAPQVALPAGRQTLTLVAPAYLLRANVAVDVQAGGVAEVRAPALGRINIRANPDNCQVFVDGTFLDYPPILDRAIAEGTHQVRFRWPDGSTREVTVEVQRGTPAYAMGRLD